MAPGPLNQFRYLGFTQQLLQFPGLGQNISTSAAQGAPQNLPFFFFTKPFAQFRSLGQATGTSPVITGVDQFLIGGPDITEQFVTFGRISAVGLSYIINPLSRKTVGNA